jgi:hypothetical protein
LIPDFLGLFWANPSLNYSGHKLEMKKYKKIIKLYKSRKRIVLTT